MTRLTATKTRSLNPNAKSTRLDADNRFGYERQLNFKQEIDLRGMRADEAIQQFTYFIDDAIRFSIARVRILHGTGNRRIASGRPRTALHTPGIESFHDEDVRFGGAGITVVNLNKFYYLFLHYRTFFDIIGALNLCCIKQVKPLPMKTTPFTPSHSNYATSDFKNYVVYHRTAGPRHADC
ncbi:Smr/MutS family protein [Duncaniella dubosii]|uniref:Smr/MutS family protein n=1 Tax=Duncaniella dubosii TaxID=2518971 RepID=UPI003F66A7C8